MSETRTKIIVKATAWAILGAIVMWLIAAAGMKQEIHFRCSNGTSLKVTKLYGAILRTREISVPLKQRLTSLGILNRASPKLLIFEQGSNWVIFKHYPYSTGESLYHDMMATSALFDLSDDSSVRLKDQYDIISR